MFRRDQYLMRALDAERHAAEAKSPDLKASYADLAESWRRLARQAEEIERTRLKLGQPSED